MQKIYILPDETVNKIAAGEVVERPASVIKELLENSIDASAKYISIEIEDAGKKLIRVVDNGSGMSKEDTKLALERHATSKIRDFTDLAKLTTLGFRGEALPSIASVSKLRITTKSKESETGWEVISEGGKIVSSQAVARSLGTTVEVSELFFNTPARKKFLKSNSTEQSHIVRIIEELAIAHFQIGFSIKADNRTLLVTPPVSKLDERIADILGNKIYGSIRSIFGEYKHMKISGFVSSLDSSQQNKNLQYFFVNKRPITNRLISQAVYDAFKDSLPIGRHPIAIILIELNSQYIDINVHPTKRLVKFTDEGEVYNFINETVRKHITTQKSPALEVPVVKVATTPQESMFEKKSEIKPVVSFSKIAKTIEMNQEQKTFEFREFHVLGQLHDTYVLVSSQDGLTIIDQHAAAERILYETFSKQTSNIDNVSAQELLIPVTLELAPHEIEIIREHIEQLNQLKFGVSEFGLNTIVFKSIPTILNDVTRLKDFFKEFIQCLIDEFSYKTTSSIEPLDRIIKSACSAAIKAKEKLSIREIENLIYELNNCSQPLCCPHGRPTMIRISISELEKKFHRA
ncbi:MAG: DNA mismatch repair endonuclease MutL [Elusimicrobiota bacterium]|nr:DNA mismatch repair endonuclease MutL [Elusimicrobiota bacterium]